MRPLRWKEVNDKDYMAHITHLRLCYQRCADRLKTLLRKRQIQENRFRRGDRITFADLKEAVVSDVKYGKEILITFIPWDKEVKLGECLKGQSKEWSIDEVPAIIWHVRPYVEGQTRTER